ncbi:hypothetical protein [Oribacterium sp. NK2B42]|uniref:hypothetical protein n=1 Tax=Oribacterium sp. NK2B42 TaxID=689781 RepID=UPI0003FA5345|nr:hypothetical protein [Oribacterium sp. NK2B42]
MILRNGLSQLLDEYADLPFKKRYTKAFIDVIDRLMEDGELDVIIDGVYIDIEPYTLLKDKKALYIKKHG